MSTRNVSPEAALFILILGIAIGVVAKIQIHADRDYRDGMKAMQRPVSISTSTCTSFPSTAVAQQ